MERVLAGRYELEVPLGRGGFGEVWRGTDMATGRPVAIKLVELGLIDDPGVLAETIGRFRREATVVSGLHHPNIVGALDAGRIGNQLFMVMELAPGISLSSMMDERGARGMGLFPAISVLRIAEQVCAGLAAAHKVGIVHRDIKPSNLMVTPSLGIDHPSVLAASTSASSIVRRGPVNHLRAEAYHQIATSRSRPPTAIGA